MRTTDPHSVHHQAQLVASGVSVTRGATPVLHQVDLSVRPGSRVAVVGENGRGKTTLLHVLAGTLDPDAGTVQLVGTLALAEQEMAGHPLHTVGDVVAEAIAEPLAAVRALDSAASDLADGAAGAAGAYASALAEAERLEAWDAERRVQVALEALGAETDPERLLAELSVGQRYRVRLACLLGARHDFLLLDEPTNHLDRSGLEFLTGRLQERAGGVVLVSHDRALLRDVAGTVLDLDPTPDGRPRVYGSGYDGYRDLRAAELQRWHQDYASEQAEHARLRADLAAAQERLVSGWRPARGTPRHQRATRAGGLVQAVHRRQETLDAHALAVPEPPQHLHLPGPPAMPEPPEDLLIRAVGVSVRNRLRRVTVKLAARGRLVVTGPNGAGKSTLLHVLGGELAPDAGAVSVDDDTCIGYLRQETYLSPKRRVDELYASHVDTLVAAGSLAPDQVIDLHDLGLLRRAERDKRVGELSTGQQRRLDLALVVAAKPQVLLLDEPTNHLSVALVDELTDALHGTRAAVVLSTHDRQLLHDVRRWPQLDLGATPSVSAERLDGCPVT